MAQAPRNPSAAHAGPYDYTTRTHMALYEKNTESLYHDKEGQYGLEPEGLQAFMLMLDDRVWTSNWREMLTYQVVNNMGIVQPMYLVDHYGEIPGPTVRAAAVLYLTAGARTSQDSEQLHQCLRKSLKKEALSRVMTERSNFQVEVGGVLLTDGPLFLMVVISLSYTNTRSMSSVYRNKLSMLTNKMQSMPTSDIIEFNTYVKSLVDLLSAGGEICEDLAWNLLRAYKSTNDKKFNAYIQLKEDAWKEGTINWGANGNDLMFLAESYYRDAKLNETWMLMSEDQERIIALEAQVQSLAAPFTRTPRKHDKGAKRENAKPDKEGGRKWPKWKDIAPKGSEPKVKTKDDTRYHWCVHHARWTVHKPEECNLANAPSPGEVAAEATTSTQAGNQRAQRITALTTVTANSDSESEYDTAGDSDSNN